ncbi:MAG: PACE efflux transporter [Rhodospirillaceae bacterium]|nr:PACE efflux transporter [Rhodospirillaceae bacterium]
MRTIGDRIRHTVTFEVIALLLVALVGSQLIGQSVEMMGALSLMFSVLVMCWNMLYNWLFDMWDQKHRKAAKRGVAIRLAHAVLFEVGLLTAGVFLVAWWLDMTLLDALILDIGFAVFFVAYAFLYNWAYGLIFPVPQQS